MMTTAHQRAGLAKLRAAVGSTTTICHHPVQRPWLKARTVAFCQLWQPEDTYQDFAARHPEWGRDDQVHARLSRLRKLVPSIQKRVFLSPWQIAQRYLQTIPEHLRRPKND